MTRKNEKGKLYIVGIGVGNLGNLTQTAGLVIDSCQAIVGYRRYIELINPILDGQEIHAYSMRQENIRCEKAIELALAGKRVALISSGDPGIYGMAGLALELISKKDFKDKLEVEIVPGLSSLNFAAANLGAPLSSDFSVISLSDLLVPWGEIEKRIEAAAKADFVIVAYNPKSTKRTAQIVRFKEICLRYRSKETPVGIVRQEGRKVVTKLTNLKDMLDYRIDMLTTVIVGNSKTVLENGKIITPRGYVV